MTTIQALEEKVRLGLVEVAIKPDRQTIPCTERLRAFLSAVWPAAGSFGCRV